MAKTSIHIVPCKVGCSEIHNRREKELDYVCKERSHSNEHWSCQGNLPQFLLALQKKIKEKTGRTMQRKSSPIREGVVVITQDTSMANLQELGQKLESKFGIKTLQIHIHRDEGHYENGGFQCNNHAHMVFDYLNHNTGKVFRPNKQQMSEIQTLTADVLGMERGNSSDKKYLNALQYKVHSNETKKQELEIAVKQESEKVEKVRKNTISFIENCKNRAIAAAQKLAEIEAPLNEINAVTEKNVTEAAKYTTIEHLKALCSKKHRNALLSKKTYQMVSNYQKEVKARLNAQKGEKNAKKEVYIDLYKKNFLSGGQLEQLGIMITPRKVESSQALKIALTKNKSLQEQQMPRKRSRLCL